jgi:hypothetical protein
MFYNTENNNDDRKLFNFLLTQNSFREKFYSRFAVYMGDILHYNSTSQVIDSIQKMLEPAMQDHLNFWMNHNYMSFGIDRMWWRDMNSWRNEVAKMKNWCYWRNAEMYKHLRSFFQLGAVIPFTYKTESDLHGKPDVFINGVRMREQGLNGSYFQGANMDLRYAGDTPSYGWEITQTQFGMTSTYTYYQQELSLTISYGCSFISIKLVNSPTAIPQFNLQEIMLLVSENHLHISNLQLPSVISIYDVNGKLITKTTTTGQSILIPFYHQRGTFIVEIQNERQKLTRKIVL